MKVQACLYIGCRPSCRFRNKLCLEMLALMGYFHGFIDARQIKAGYQTTRVFNLGNSKKFRHLGEVSSLIQQDTRMATQTDTIKVTMSQDRASLSSTSSNSEQLDFYWVNHHNPIGANCIFRQIKKNHIEHVGN
jgi:hypothetical protein